MALFDTYLASHHSYARKAAKPVALSALIHLFLILAIFAVPLMLIRHLPPPAVPLGVFESAPPPPPPPPPPGGSSQEKKPKEDKKPKEPTVLKEPTKVEKVVKDESSSPPVAGGVQGGVEGGVAGGVVGGVLGGIPGKMLVQAQRKISGDDPYFPPSARAQRLTGMVAARVCISDLGKVTDVKILRGVPAFNDSVEKAVRGWRYEPYMANGKGVPACFPVYFNFNLKE